MMQSHKQSLRSLDPVQGMRSRRRLATGNPVARFGAEDGVGLRRGTARHGSLWGMPERVSARLYGGNAGDSLPR